MVNPEKHPFVYQERFCVLEVLVIVAPDEIVAAAPSATLMFPLTETDGSARIVTGCLWLPCIAEEA